MTNPITIAGRQIGPGEPPWIVAEMSANHNRSFERAVKIIDAAAATGADAIKVQAFSPEEMTLDNATVAGEWGKPLLSLYRQAAMPWEWLPELKAHAADKGLVFFASVFSPHGVELTEALIDPPCYKIASFELIDVPLLRAVASTGKPVILSTGMASGSEVEDALAQLRGGGCAEVALLHCVSSYPASAESMCLRKIPEMQERFGVPVGLSDHSFEYAVSVSAAALGAAIIEVHVTTDDAFVGELDAEVSWPNRLLRVLIDQIRVAQRASIGMDSNGDLLAAVHEEEAPLSLRRSLYVTEDINAGELLTPQNVACLRPAKGLEPKYYDDVLGRRAAVKLDAGTPLRWELVSENKGIVVGGGVE